jgi:hypothetical protein
MIMSLDCFNRGCCPFVLGVLLLRMWCVFVWNSAHWQEMNVCTTQVVISRAFSFVLLHKHFMNKKKNLSAAM